MKKWAILGAIYVGLLFSGCYRKKPVTYKKTPNNSQKTPNSKLFRGSGSGGGGGASADAQLVARGKKLYASKGCVSCHSTDGSPRIGPTMKDLYGKKRAVVTDGKERLVTADEKYLDIAIKNPDADIVKGFKKGQMMLFQKVDDSERKAIVTYVKSLSSAKATAKTPKTVHKIEIGKAATHTGPNITSKEMVKASKIYFNRCAGCHGMLRKGATGPALLPKTMLKKGSGGIKAIVNYGLPGGMPAWGTLGILNPADIDLIARFLQNKPPAPPEMSLADMKKTWKVYVEPAKRPVKAFHKNWRNFFGVILRDAGKVAILDGTTHEKIAIVNTGFAVHILRSSASGRYFYSIGRDGRVTMIDLWMEKPDKVAEVKACYDARSVDASKYYNKKTGVDYRDKYLIVGGYWPPSLIIMDGQTLQPLKLFSTSGYTVVTDEYKKKGATQEYLREARAAAIVASHHDPLWVVNIKETGQVWLVDYTDLDNLKINAIAAERFLHDGGWDGTKRYVLMAANARNTIAVVDTYKKKLAALVKVGKIPHPGRGANIIHPKYGPMWLTGHLGDNTIACIGTDPKGHPQYAWKVAATFKLPGNGGGNLFLKTHPKSKYIWIDRPLHPNTKVCKTIYVYDKVTLKLVKTYTLPDKYSGRAVHFEYNAEGTQVWLSAWSPKTKVSGLIIFDDKTLKVIKEVNGKWLVTPTGKFNVKNTTEDIY